ncbi:MAG: ComF family protein [Prolixibacteraceae bacterium]|jgi:ComF family protein|nr:ComF family protein [Prolixibacteraceae bacterium]
MLLDDLLSLFYPNLCAGCHIALMRGEGILCLGCLADLPKTGFEKIEDNQVARLFWGRANIKMATSFCTFDKGGIMQHLMHQLKYQGRKDIGEKLGFLMGTDLANSPPFHGIELILPVPLHPKRQHKRGYNQSAVVGKGVADAMGVPFIENVLVRNRYSNTQTNKGRFERWENVKELFGVRNPEILEGKHILLVDDVVTTGSTLEACAQVLLKIPGTKVSIATLACA